MRCERCTNCKGGVQRCADGFAFQCASCGGSGWIHGEAADIVAGIRMELRAEAGIATRVRPKG